MPALVLVLQGPSGVGKSTVREKLLSNDSNFRFAVSVTTRRMRPAEVEGKDYHFIDRIKFEELIECGSFAEWSSYGGNYYGTYRSEIEEPISAGLTVVSELDIPGAKAFQQLWPDRCVVVLLLPPTWEELERRLHTRRTDSNMTIAKRLSTARPEVREGMANADYLVVNRDVNLTSAILRALLRNRISLLNGEVDKRFHAMTERWRKQGLSELQRLLKAHWQPRLPF